jgi:nucleoside-diphosphate-sugar epimerase
MRILITGAAGFIGGRVTEAFHESGFATVRAGVRQLPVPPRIDRLPVEVVPCDMMDTAQLSRALEATDAVVHCARGPGEVTVRGTSNILEASLRAGVGRFVHLSTIDVYGDATGLVDEATPVRLSGAEYGDSKIESEEACWSYLERGLPVSILRPTIVYGPFSASWTIEFARRLQVRPWPFPPEVCHGTCNLLYVDDLVAAIRLALTESPAVGEAFNINGPERPTWHEYFSALNAAMGLPPIEASASTSSWISAWAIKPVRRIARFGLQHFGDQITALAERPDWVGRALSAAETRIRKAPTTGEFELYSRHVSFPIDKARRLLGYAPIMNMDRGIELSVEWLLRNGYIQSSAGSAPMTGST